MNRKLILGLIAASVFGFVVTIPAFAAYESALKAYWTFDQTSGTVLDSSSNGTNGSVWGGVSRSNEGKYGNAYYFNGGGIDFGNHVNLQTNTPFTISTWVKYPGGQPDGSYRRIYSKEYSIFLGGASNQVIGDVSSSWSYGAVRTSSAPSANTWHNVTMTLSNPSNGTLRLYVDGVQVSSATGVNMYNNTNGASIGYGAGTSGQYFIGYLDDVGVWDRALDVNEINAINTVGIETFENITVGLNTTLSLGYTTAEIEQMADLYAQGSGSATIHGETWYYSDEDAPGHSIGDAWTDGTYYYLYLGTGTTNNPEGFDSGGSSIPEPATLFILGPALLGMFGLLRKRKNK